MKMPITVKKKKPWWAGHVEIMSYLRRRGYVMSIVYSIASHLNDHKHVTVFKVRMEAANKNH
jgi:hypothetical protein